MADWCIYWVYQLSIYNTQHNVLYNFKATDCNPKTKHLKEHFYFLNIKSTTKAN